MTLTQALAGLHAGELSSRLSAWLAEHCDRAEAADSVGAAAIYLQVINDLSAVIRLGKQRLAGLDTLALEVKQLEEMRTREECLREIDGLLDSIQTFFHDARGETR